MQDDRETKKNELRGYEDMKGSDKTRTPCFFGRAFLSDLLEGLSSELP